MGKLAVVLLLVLALWVGLTIHREGADRAFGGLFELLSRPQYGEEAPETRTQRLAEEQADREPPRPDPDEGPWWAEP